MPLGYNPLTISSGILITCPFASSLSFPLFLTHIAGLHSTGVHLGECQISNIHCQTFSRMIIFNHMAPNPTTADRVRHLTEEPTKDRHKGRHFTAFKQQSQTQKHFILLNSDTLYIIQILDCCEILQHIQVHHPFGGHNFCPRKLKFYMVGCVCVCVQICIPTAHFLPSLVANVTAFVSR